QRKRPRYHKGIAAGRDRLRPLERRHAARGVSAGQEGAESTRLHVVRSQEPVRPGRLQGGRPPKSDEAGRPPRSAPALESLERAGTAPSGVSRRHSTVFSGIQVKVKHGTSGQNPAGLNSFPSSKETVMVTRRQTGVLRILACVALILSLLTFNAAVSPGVARVTVATAAPLSFDTATRARVNATYGRLPLYFEANEGQTDPQVKFLARGAGQALFLTSTEAVLVLTKADPQAQGPQRTLASPMAARAGTQTVLRMTFVGASPQPRITGQRELTGKVNYFLGNDPVKWRTNVPTYAAVRYEGLYPGSVVVYSTYLGGTAWDEGKGIAVDGQGNAYVVGMTFSTGSTSGSPGSCSKPDADIFVTKLNPTGSAIVYTTYLAGSGGDIGTAIAVDGQGSAYVTGETCSTNFPTTPGAFASASSGSADAFVTKLNPAGSALVYSTYLGGSGVDLGTGIAVDAQGNAVVTGGTS